MSKLPILLISYKRLDTTKKVMNSIKSYKPKEIYLFSDGPKTLKKDNDKVNDVRKYLEQAIDWDCSIKKMFSFKNLGCKFGPQSAITWFFENVDKGIILEDDCVPTPDFYTFCEVLLTRFENDLRIFNICGNKIAPNTFETESGYYFSKIAYNWGWATWANRWELHLENLKVMPELFQKEEIKNILPNKSHIKNFEKFVMDSLENRLDAWDYQWRFSILTNNGLSIMPSNNLIEYVGFGEESTHTSSSEDSTIPRETSKINWPLNHPTAIVPNSIVDNYILSDIYNWKSLSEKLTFKHISESLKSRLNRIV